MDTFCILSEQALSHQWNFDFVHSNTACMLLHKGGMRPGWKATVQGLAVTSLSHADGARKNKRSGMDLVVAGPISSHSHQNTFHAFLCHVAFFVTRITTTYLVFSLVRWLTALDSLVPSFMYLLPGKHLNHLVRYFMEMRVLKLRSIFTMVIERMPRLPLDLWFPCHFRWPHKNNLIGQKTKIKHCNMEKKHGSLLRGHIPFSTVFLNLTLPGSFIEKPLRDTSIE